MGLDRLVRLSAIRRRERRWPSPQGAGEINKLWLNGRANPDTPRNRCDADRAIEKLRKPLNQNGLGNCHDLVVA